MRVRISLQFLLSLALIFASSTLDYAVIFLASACIHEAGHLTFLFAYGVKKPELSLGLLGAVISADTSSLSYRKESAVYLGGALFNALACAVSLIVLRYRFDSRLLFFCFSNMFYALFNLLPIGTLDGGRALECLLLSRSIDPWRAERDADRISRIFSAFTCVLSAYLILSAGANLTLVTLFLLALYQCIPSKPLCRSTS